MVAEQYQNVGREEPLDTLHEFTGELAWVQREGLAGHRGSIRRVVYLQTRLVAWQGETKGLRVRIRISGCIVASGRSRSTRCASSGGSCSYFANEHGLASRRQNGS